MVDGGSKMKENKIAGYTYGTNEVARSPLSEQEFDLLKQTVLFTDEDVRYLRMAGEVLADQVEDVLDAWYGFVVSHPHLVHYFSDRDGKPILEYLTAVRARFGQWMRDTCAARYESEREDRTGRIALKADRQPHG